MAILSSREIEVARLCAKGMTSKEIGRALLLAPRTVEHHLERAKYKLGAKNCAHFVSILYETGLIAPRAEKSDQEGIFTDVNIPAYLYQLDTTT